MKKRTVFLPIISLLAIGVTSCGPATSSCNDMWCDASDSGGDNSSIYVPPVVDMQVDPSENYSLEDVSIKDGSLSYEVFVRSFYDADGDGIGDFKGLEQKLPYLASLGVNNLWLMPIHPSPTYHGYDVKDYYDVNPDFGTLDDFKQLLKSAHDLGMHIIIDMVLNHSSDENPWFVQSYSDMISGKTGDDSKADWYVWSDNRKSGYYPYKKSNYECQFDASMPDLNYDSTSLRNEVENIIKYWVEMGVDGFRLDAVKYYYMNQTNKNVEVLSWFKEVATRYNPDFYMVGECWDSNEIIESYFKSTCDSFFKFSSSLEGVGNESLVGQVKSYVRSNTFATAIEEREAKVKENNPNGYYSYFLANHDMNRASSSLKDEDAKMAASLYCLLPGMPYMYYGEEISIKGRRGDNDHSDVRRRLPMIWSENNKTGECLFPESSRLDLSDNEQVSLGADDQEKIPFSLLNHYKKVGNVRNKYPFMKNGVFKNRCSDLNTLDEHVLAYEISLGDESIVIIHNFNDYNVEVDVSNIGTLIDSEINTGHYLPEINNGKLKLGMYSTVVIK